MEFCPRCGRRLGLRFRSKGALYCPRCNHKTELTNRYSPEKWLSNAEISDTSIVVLDKDVMKLLTHPTISTYCEECGAKKAETWAVTFGSEGLCSIIYYRCLTCGHTWRETE